MKHTIRTLLLIVALLATSEADAQLLWKVTGNGLEKPSYVLGTHHLAPPSIVDDVKGLGDALASVGQAAGEIDMVSVSQTEIANSCAPFMMAPQDSTLSKLYDADTFAALDSRLKEVMGTDMVSLAMFDALRPMAVNSVVSVMVMQSRLPGYDPSFQLDAYVQNTVKDSGRKIIGLETPQQQAEVLYVSTPISQQAADLKNMLEHPDELITEAEKLNELYFAGKLDEMLAYTLEQEEGAAFLDALLNRRNVEWLKVLPGLIKERPTVVAVGALHLPGSAGILAGLRNAGFTVVPVE